MSFKEIKTVLISDKVDSCCDSTLKANGFTVVSKPGLSADELKVEIENVDALIVRSATKVTSDVMLAAKRLKLIGRAGTGVDNIDVKFATQQGIIVMNTPGGNTLSAAEHTCALIAAMARLIPQAYASLSVGKWERSKFMGVELSGKTLAIIGLGRIGKEVAFRMQSYGMKTVGFDPIVSKEEAEEWNIDYLQLEDIWPIADFITVHTPLIPQTKGLLSKETFAKCKQGVRVINVARGGIIDEGDLLAALQSGQCAGAALDVFMSEPPTATSLDLIQHPCVVGTPHLGASTTEAQVRVAKDIAEQITDLVSGAKVFGVINGSAVEMASRPDMAPWIQLADRLGTVVSTCHPGPVTGDVVVHTRGDVLKLAGRAIACGVATGLVRGEHVSANIISAVSLAERSGIKVSSKHVQGDASVSVYASSNLVATGTVMCGVPYLTCLFNCPFACPVPLRGCLLLDVSTQNSSRLDVFASISGHASVSSVVFACSGDGSRCVAAASCASGVDRLTLRDSGLKSITF